MVLLIIPLRPSVWDREESSSEGMDSIQVERKDSFLLTTVTVLDTQVVLRPSEDSTGTEETLVVTSTEKTDTTIITLLATPVASPKAEKAAVSSPSFLFLMGWFLFFSIIALGLYQWLIKRWQKEYWLEYSAKLQPLATLGGSSSTVNFDFSNIDLKSKDVAISKKDEEEEIVLKGKEEEIVPIEPDDELEVEATLEPEAISDHSEKENTSIPKTITTAPIDTKITSSNSGEQTSTPFLSRWYMLFLIEIFSRLPRIIIEIGRGLGSIFSFFSEGNQKRRALDLKWQDGISVVMILFFVACKTIIFPDQPTNFSGNILIWLLVWCSPALIRLHWGWGVLGIVIILSEFIGLIIYVILQALKDAKPSDGDFTIYWIGGAASASILFLYWANKKNWLPKFKASSLIALLLTTIAGYYIFLPYLNNWEEALDRFGSWGDVFARLVLLYVIFESILLLLNLFIKDKSKVTTTKDKTPIKIDTPPVEKIDSSKDKTVKTEKTSVLLSEEDLTALFKLENWYKKTPLDQLMMIDMSNKQLNEQSEFIVLYLPDCINLRALNLSNNHLEEVPYEISVLTQLRILDLSNNRIKTFSSEIEYLENLEVILLTDNNISEIPVEITKLKKLTQIDLSGNPLTVEAINKLKNMFPNIEVIYDEPIVVEEEKIIAVEEDEDLVEKVRGILKKELKEPERFTAISTLMNKKLLDLPLSVLQELPRLHMLFLNSNLFEAIPAAIYQLPNIKTLGMSYNKITSIPDEIGTLENLEELDLSGNPIQNFSPRIAHLKKLKRLSLGNLGLTAVPAFVLKMEQLELLNLEGNHILRIPDNIQNLVHLKHLNLNFSGLNVIPKEIFLLENLRTLNWVGNNLKMIPSQISALKKLEKLDVGFNKELESSTSILSELPSLKNLRLSGLRGGVRQPMIADVGSLENLEILELSYNELNELPETLFNLTKLQKLNLENNQLTRLPEEIGNLSNLKHLFLSKNQLKNLPSSIKKLKKLRHLYLIDNPLDIREKRALQRALSNVTIHF